HNRLFREISRDKLRQVTYPCQKRKPLKNQRFPLFFRGMRKRAKSGGGGNRTRVPRHFSVGFYVCSLSTSISQSLATLPITFATAFPDKQGFTAANPMLDLT